MDKKAVLAAGFVDLTGEAASLREGQALLIEGDRVQGYVDRKELPTDVEVVDRSEYYALPGLVDISFLPALMYGREYNPADHYGTAVWNARAAAGAWLNSGVTSAGTLGAVDRHDLDLAAILASGRFRGPRLIPALSPLVPIGASQFPPLYGVQEVHGPDEARCAARTLIKQGAQRIIVYADVPMRFDPDPYETSRERFSFAVEELSEITAQAAQAGCYVHAQAVSTAAIQVCIQAGVRSIGCAFGLQAGQLSHLKERGVALAPNLALGATVEAHGPAAGIPDASVSMVAAQRISADLLQEAESVGVELVCGTNAAFQEGTVYRECCLMQQAGLAVDTILRAATTAAGRCLKPYVEWGALEPYFFADLLFLQGNPLETLESLAQPADIMMGGQIL